MKSKLIAAGLIALAAAGAAQAECVAFEQCSTLLDTRTSLTTREAVRAEVIAARKAGTLGDTDNFAFDQRAQPTTVTAEEVRAGAVQAARKPINLFYPG
ncbi:MAG TPA: DUF4148 domain-containing protein [Burkholderiaceae bacterium]